MGVPAITWQPWCDDVIRLYLEGFGASEISRRLNKSPLDVIAVMDLPRFKEDLAVQQAEIKLLFMQRLVNLWGLSETMVTVARTTAETYLQRLADGAPEKEIRELRKDALQVMKDVLDRIGLKAPDKSELQVFERREVVDSTPLATYEKRLELIRGYKEQGMTIPEGLSRVDLDG